jgi:hypothetical protein
MFFTYTCILEELVAILSVQRHLVLPRKRLTCLPNAPTFTMLKWLKNSNSKPLEGLR